MTDTEWERERERTKHRAAFNEGEISLPHQPQQHHERWHNHWTEERASTVHGSLCSSSHSRSHCIIYIYIYIVTDFQNSDRLYTDEKIHTRREGERGREGGAARLGNVEVDKKITRVYRRRFSREGGHAAPSDGETCYEPWDFSQDVDNCRCIPATRSRLQ